VCVCVCLCVYSRIGASYVGRPIFVCAVSAPLRRANKYKRSDSYRALLAASSARLSPRRAAPSDTTMPSDATLLPSHATLLPSDVTLPSDATLPSAATWRRVAHAVRASRLLSRPVSTSGMLRAKLNAPHAARLLRSALQRHTRLLSVAEPSSAPQAALRPVENAAAMLTSPRRAAGGGRSSAGGRGASLPWP
jgi:hypothetical protein